MRVYINEIKLPSGNVTYRTTDRRHTSREPLAAGLRSECFYVWERSLLLAKFTDSRPMHPADWAWEACAWQPHAPIDDILAAQGYEETPAATEVAA